MSLKQKKIKIKPRIKLNHNTYMIIFFLNNGQSNVKVSYSPPSPQTFEPYLQF